MPAVLQNPGPATFAKVGWLTLKCHLYKGWGPTTSGRGKVRVATGAFSDSTHVPSGGKPTWEAHRKLHRHRHHLVELSDRSSLYYHVHSISVFFFFTLFTEIPNRDKIEQKRFISTIPCNPISSTYYSTTVLHPSMTCY